MRLNRELILGHVLALMLIRQIWDCVMGNNTCHVTDAIEAILYSNFLLGTSTCHGGIDNCKQHKSKGVDTVHFINTVYHTPVETAVDPNCNEAVLAFESLLCVCVSSNQTWNQFCRLGKDSVLVAVDC